MSPTRKSRVKRARRVEIEWNDAAMLNTAWTDVVEWREQTSLAHVVTLGWLVERTSKYVLVALSVHLNDDGSISRVGACLEIPAGCVIAVRPVKRPTCSPLR